MASTPDPMEEYTRLLREYDGAKLGSGDSIAAFTALNDFVRGLVARIAVLEMLLRQARRNVQHSAMHPEGKKSYELLQAIDTALALATPAPPSEPEPIASDAPNPPLDATKADLVARLRGKLSVVDARTSTGDAGFSEVWLVDLAAVLREAVDALEARPEPIGVGTLYLDGRYVGLLDLDDRVVAGLESEGVNSINVRLVPVEGP